MFVSLITDDERIGGRVRHILLQEGVACPASQIVPVDLAIDRLAQVEADLVVFVLGDEPEHALAVLSRLQMKNPGRVLAVGPASDPKLLLRTLRAGADDYADQDDLDVHVREALRRCRGVRRGHEEEVGRLIPVLAPSGGSGSSTIAANIATVLAKEHKQTALLDMKLEAGDLSALLDLKPTHTLADLCHDLSRLDGTLLDHTLVRHASGVHLLAPPRRLSDVRHVTPEAVRRVLALARSAFPYVIVDLDHSFRDEQTEVLQQADIIVMVLRLDFTALRNARRTLDHFEELGIDQEKVRLVINRYGQAKEVPAARAEQALGVKIFHYVPDEPKTVNRANNNGVPLVLEAPSAKVSKSVAKLAASVNGRHRTH